MNEEQLKILAEALGLDEAAAKLAGEMIKEATDTAKAEGKKEGKEESDKEKEDSDKAKDAEKEEMKEAYEAQIASLMESANAYGNSIAASAEATATAMAQTAVDEFIAENTERFVAAETVERAQSAIQLMKEALEQNGFNINTNAELETAQNALQEANAQFESQSVKLFEAVAARDSMARELKFVVASESLSENQREKARELLEGFEFNTEEEFDKGLSLLVEKAKEVPAPVEQTLTEGLDTAPAAAAPKSKLLTEAAAYLNRTGRQ